MYKLLSLLLLGSLLQCTQGFSDTQTASDGKLYVKKRSVRIIDKEIIIFTKDGAFAAPSLTKDDNGVYVNTQELQKRDIKNRYKDKKEGSHSCRKHKRGVPPHVVKMLRENPNVPRDVVDKLCKQSQEQRKEHQKDQQVVPSDAK